MPVPITCNNSRLPTFWQDQLTKNATLWQVPLPTNGTMQMYQISTSMYCLSTFVNSALHLRCLLYAGSALLSSTNPNHAGLQVQTLKYRIGCYEGLSQSVGPTASHLDRFALLQNLSLLFIAALLVNDRWEASIHAKKICDEIATCRTGPHLSLDEKNKILGLVHYYDNLCAMQYLTPPILDTRLLQSVWDSTDLVKGYSAEELAGFHGWRQSDLVPHTIVKVPLADPPLDKHHSFRQRLIARRSQPAHEDMPQSTIILLMITKVRTELTIRILEHLKQAKRRYASQPNSITCAGMVLSAALVAWFAGRVTGPVILTYRTTASRPMAALRGAIRLMRSYIGDPVHSLLLQHVLLWALHVGAMWEWDSGVYRSGESWFVPQLQAVVQELKLTRWSEFVSICDQFLYFRGEDSQSSVWFPGMGWPQHLAWAGAGCRQKSSTAFLRELLFDGAFRAENDCGEI
jgi:hypothetical protein